MTADDAVFRDASQQIGDRVADLLSRLTLEEKAGQLSQYFYFGAVGQELSAADDAGRAHSQPKLVEEAITAGRAGSILFVKDALTANTLQRMAVEQTRLGIPLIFGFDVIHGLRTVFPPPIALAATWDPATIGEAQSFAAREARAVGIHWTFAPMVDIARDPRWGRMVEGAGEDPFLGSAVAAAQVRGFQGDLDEQHVLAGPKHFAGYGAARGGRDYEEAEISDSELHNVYLPPFRAAIEAGAGNIMGAYMDVNGVPASGNRRLLTELLREELGFDGFVVSDANAVKSLETQHFAASRTDAGVRAITAGLDMEMCMVDPAFDLLPDAVAAGDLDESVIDVAVRRVLTAKFRLGLFERPYADEERAESTLADPASRASSQRAAARSAVLLKNGGTLPLAADAVGSIAVVGQLASSRRDILGPWVFAHDIDETVDIVSGIRARVGDGVQVDYAPGAGIPNRVFPSIFDPSDEFLETTPADYDDDAEIDRAVAIAASAGVAIVVVGERQNQIGENASRSVLDLPGRQLEQLQRIVATGTPTVLVVMSGRPLDLRWAEGNVDAILQVWYPGTRGGDAVAALLFGDASPAGHLPFSWPRHVGQVPVIGAHLRSFAPDDQSRRYWNEESTPLYPFGHGLSYTTFAIGEPSLDRARIAVGETATVSVDVANTGATVGATVVQLYVHQRFGTSSRPVRELKGFDRVELSPGETRTVRFEIGPEQLRYWSAAVSGWVQDATTIDLGVGETSAIELATTLNVAAIPPVM